MNSARKFPGDFVNFQDLVLDTLFKDSKCHFIVLPTLSSRNMKQTLITTPAFSSISSDTHIS